MMARNSTVLALAALLLAGCGDSDVREVRTWMDETRAQTRPMVKPLPAPKEFVPYAYDQQARAGSVQRRQAGRSGHDDGRGEQAAAGLESSA